MFKTKIKDLILYRSPSLAYALSFIDKLFSLNTTNEISPPLVWDLISYEHMIPFIFGLLLIFPWNIKGDVGRVAQKVLVTEMAELPGNSRYILQFSPKAFFSKTVFNSFAYKSA